MNNLVTDTVITLDLDECDLIVNMINIANSLREIIEDTLNQEEGERIKEDWANSMIPFYTGLNQLNVGIQEALKGNTSELLFNPAMMTALLDGIDIMTNLNDLLAKLELPVQYIDSIRFNELKQKLHNQLREPSLS